jgi:hypothetical protein
MFGSKWKLFRLLGIPVFLDASWLVIFALLTISLAGLFPDLMTTYYPEAVSEQPPWVYWLMGVLGAVAFFSCILKEQKGSILVAYRGRVSRQPRY